MFAGSRGTIERRLKLSKIYERASRESREDANTFAKKVAIEQDADGQSRKRMERISASFLK